MNGSSKNAKPVLSLTNVYKHFGGVIAAEDVNLDFFGGEVLGLIGPNGAGKTTLVNLITGIYAADRGTIVFNGRDITKFPTYKRAQLGIARTFQHPRLLDRCSVLDNILLGMDLATKEGRQNKQGVQSEMMDLLTCAGLRNASLKGPISKLSYGQQKMLELVRAILSNPSVLLLDEPAAGLNHSEMQFIVALIDVAVKKGIAVLLIEHAMDLVMNVSHRLTVLNFGHQIANGTPAEIQENPVVIEAYLGGKRNVNH